MGQGFLFRCGPRKDWKIIPIEDSKKKIQIGRDLGENDICISSHCISRRHVQLWCNERRYFVRDLLSLNGTFVYDRSLTRQLSPGEAFEIFPGYLIGIGIDQLDWINQKEYFNHPDCYIYVLKTENTDDDLADGLAAKLKI